MGDLQKQHQQKEIIKNLMANSVFTPEESGYVVSSVWMRNWKRYVGYNGQISTDLAPGTIDNRHLMGADHTLRKNATMGLDYEIVTKIVWDTFKKWYNGSPEIKVEMAFDPRKNKCVPVLRLSNYEIYFGNESKKLLISKYKPMETLIKKASELFGLDPEMYTIYDFTENRIGRNLEISKIICEHMLEENQKLILKLKSEKIEEATPQSRAQSMPVIPDFGEEPTRKSTSLDSINELSKQLIKGAIGLTNIGNSCYMNTVLQCLFHAPQLLNYFESGAWTTNPHGSHQSGAVLFPYLSLMKTEWSGVAHTASPADLKFAIEKFAPQFVGNDPHDAHEFLTVLLRCLHDETNRAHGKVAGIKVTRDPNTAWKALHATDDSPIIDLFFGMARHQLSCPLCGHTQSSFEPYMTLSLPMPSRRVATVSFVFVPAKPSEPMRQMKLKLFEDSSAAEFAESLGIELKRTISVAFADVANSHAVWIPQFQEPHKGHETYVFELTPGAEMHAAVWLCLRVKKPLSRNTIELGAPFLVPIPGEATTEEQVQDICERFFSYLWEPTTSMRYSMSDDIAELQAKLRSFKHPTEHRIKVRLDRSFFSKTMRFKPTPAAPSIARRNVWATLNADYLGQQSTFNWALLRRQVRQVAAMPVNRAVISLEACLRGMQADEILDSANAWYCSGCGEAVPAVTQTLIWDVPSILVIQLKRFFMEGFRVMKNDAFVKYPLILDMTPYTEQSDKPAGRYQLFAVGEHQGSLVGGHYKAKTYVEGTGRWFNFDDTSIREIREDEIVCPNAYLLFYKKIE